MVGIWTFGLSVSCQKFWFCGYCIIYIPGGSRSRARQCTSLHRCSPSVLASSWCPSTQVCVTVIPSILTRANLTWPLHTLAISSWLMPAVTQPTPGSPELLTTHYRGSAPAQRWLFLIKKCQLPITCVKRVLFLAAIFRGRSKEAIEYQMLFCCQSAAAETKKQHYPPNTRMFSFPLVKQTFYRVTDKLQWHFRWKLLELLAVNPVAFSWTSH